MLHMEAEINDGCGRCTSCPDGVFLHTAQAVKPIKSISLTIKAEIKPDTDFGDELIEIETSSNKYSVDGYRILNDDSGMAGGHRTQNQITLTANDDYYFQSLPRIR